MPFYEQNLKKLVNLEKKFDFLAIKRGSSALTI